MSLYEFGKLLNKKDSYHKDGLIKKFSFPIKEQQFWERQPISAFNILVYSGEAL